MEHMKATVNLDKCPACGSVLSLDDNTGKIICRHCDNSFTYEELKSKEASDTDCDGEYDEYSCNDCGGVIVTDKNSITSVCPYCGNTSVMKDRITGSYRPDYIIPFRITPKQAEDNFTQVLHNKMVKRSFKKKFQIEEITSLFVPFWLYNTDILAEITHEYITYDKKGNAHTKLKSVKFTESYDKIPVDASLKMDDDKMDRLEPYDYAELKPFDKAYFIGHKAEKYDTDVRLVRKRAEKRMDKAARTSFSRYLYDNSASADDVLLHVMGTAAGRVTSKVVNGTMKAMGKEEMLSNPNFSFDNEYIADNTNIDRIKKSKVKADLSDYRYALFPVYLIRGSYRGKKRLYYVNGQTGKVAEDFPFSYLEYYLNRIAGTLVGSLLVGGIFSILIRCFIRLWEENNDIQPGIPGGIIFLISWLAAFLLLNILETKNNGKESLREAKGTVGEAAVVQNVRNYRVSGSFKIIKD
jgi:DNA-directed RNA polymerase subunit RPC12/RpoP